MKRRFTRFTVIFIGVACVLALAEIAMAAATNYQIGDKQLIADGSMEKSGTTSWTAYGGATLSKETASPHGGKQNIKALYNGSVNPGARQNVLTVGKKYRLSGWFRSGDGVKTAYAQIGTTYATTTNTAWTRFDFSAFATEVWVYLYSDCSGAGQYVEYDDVYVTEYQGKEQNSEKQLLADGSMEKSGTTSWSSSEATLTKETASPHGGKQFLRITKNGTVPIAYQSIISSGKRYLIKGWFRGDGTSSPRALANDGSWLTTGTASATWQSFSIDTGVQTGIQVRFQVVNGSNGNYVDVDDVYVTEYQGKAQIFEKQLLVDGSMEKSGTTSWTALNITLSKQTTSPHGGKQVLRLAYNTTAGGTTYQGITTSGKSYRVTGFARSDGTAIPSFSFGAASKWTGTNSTAWQIISIITVADGGYFNLEASNLSAARYVEFDDVYVTQIPN